MPSEKEIEIFLTELGFQRVSNRRYTTSINDRSFNLNVSFLDMSKMEYFSSQRDGRNIDEFFIGYWFENASNASNSSFQTTSLISFKEIVLGLMEIWNTEIKLERFFDKIKSNLKFKKNYPGEYHFASKAMTIFVGQTKIATIDFLRVKVEQENKQEKNILINIQDEERVDKLYECLKQACKFKDYSMFNNF